MAKDEFISLLDQMPGRKDLVIDGELMKPLDRIASVSLLKQRGVDKIFKFDSSLKSMHGCEQRIYLVRPRMTTMKAIADHINSDRNINFKRKYSIIFVPRKDVNLSKWNATLNAWEEEKRNQILFSILVDQVRKIRTRRCLEMAGKMMIFRGTFKTAI